MEEYKNSVAGIIHIVALIVLIGGIIGSVAIGIMTPTASGAFNIGALITSLVSTVGFGVVLLGLCEIIEILHDMREKMGASPRRTDEGTSSKN